MRITIASDEPKELEDALALLLREELALDFGVRQMQLPASAALAHTILSLTTRAIAQLKIAGSIWV